MSSCHVPVVDICTLLNRLNRHLLGGVAQPMSIGFWYLQERRRQQRIAEITEMIHVASLLHDDVIDNAGAFFILARKYLLRYFCQISHRELDNRMHMTYTVQLGWAGVCVCEVLKRSIGMSCLYACI